jgi:hypothetical protein
MHILLQIILRYFAVFYVPGLLRDCMTSSAHEKVTGPFLAKPYAASRYRSSLHTLAPVATHTMTHVCLDVVSFFLFRRDLMNEEMKSALKYPCIHVSHSSCIQASALDS